MNSSMEGTSSTTSFNIVLYCESRRVHAGEYLFAHNTQIILSFRNTMENAEIHHSLGSWYGIPHVRPFEVV